MADELIDIFDENMRLLGQAMKSQAHREGLWHKTFHCWLVRRAEDGQPMVWLQRRNYDKRIYPGMLDVSAAGHVKAGEEVKDGYREVTEGLGITLNQDDLVKMFTIKEVYQQGDIYNREFEVLYMAKVEHLLSKVQLQADEVAGLYEVKLSELRALLSGELKSIEAEGVRRNDDNSYTWENIDIRPGDLAPPGNDYYGKSLDMLQRYVENLPQKAAQ